MGYIFYDIESYPDLFILIAKINGIHHRFTICDNKGISNPDKFIKFYQEHKSEIWVGWNSSSYDSLVVSYIMQNPYISAREIKMISDYVITGKSKFEKAILEKAPFIKLSGRGEDTKLWLSEPIFQEFDLLKWGKNQFMSLKDVQITFGEKQHKSPFAFDEEIIKGSVPELRLSKALLYCIHDVDTTEKIFEYYRERGVLDIRNSYLELFPNSGTWPQAKLAEKFFLEVYTKNYRTEYPKVSPEIDVTEIEISDIPQISMYNFEDKDIEKSYNDFIQKTIHIDKYKPKLDDIPCVDRLGNMFKLGVGGLHSSDIKGLFVADAEHRLVNVDAASFWPSIIDTLKLNSIAFPKYHEVVGAIRKKTVEAKHSGDKKTHGFMKLTVNSLNGKAGERYSPLYSQMLSCGFKIHGQFMLLKLWDMLLSKSDDLQMINANTDGLIFRVHKHVDIESVFCEWSDRYNIVLEWEDYERIAQSSVNDYFAVTESGKIKTKGGSFSMDIDIDKKSTKSRASKFIAIEILKGRNLTEVLEEVKQKPPSDFIVTFTATKSSKYKIHPFGETGTVALCCTNDGVPVYKDRFNEKRNKEEIIRFNEGWLFSSFDPDIKSDINYQFYIKEAQKIIDSVMEV